MKMLSSCWSADMFILKRRGVFLLSGAVSLGAVILLTSSMATTEWVRGDLQRTLRVTNANGSRIIVVYGGYKHFGLFRGCEERYFSTLSEPRRRCFNALLEVEHLSDTHMVYATLVGMTAALFFLLVAIHICIYIEYVTDVKESLETTSIYFMYISAVIASVAACALYGYMYHKDFRLTILTAVDLRQGFSSHQHIHLSHSYWMAVAATIATFLNLIAVFLTNVRCGKSSCFNKDFTRRSRAAKFGVVHKMPASNGADMMMY